MGTVPQAIYKRAPGAATGEIDLKPDSRVLVRGNGQLLLVEALF